MVKKRKRALGTLEKNEALISGVTPCSAVDDVRKVGTPVADAPFDTQSNEEKGLESVTEYEDGTIEKEFCINEIGAADKEGERITAEQFAYSSGSNGNSATNYGVTLVCTIYATMRVSDVPSANQVTYRCDKVTSTLVCGGEIYPGTGTTEYCHTKGNEYKKAAFTASVAINQSYTLTANGGFYRSNDIPLTGGLWAQSFVNLSNGKSMNVQAGIPQDDPFK